MCHHINICWYFICKAVQHFIHLCSILIQTGRTLKVFYSFRDKFLNIRITAVNINLIYTLNRQKSRQDIMAKRLSVGKALGIFLRQTTVIKFHRNNCYCFHFNLSFKTSSNFILLNVSSMPPRVQFTILIPCASAYSFAA